MYFIDSISSAFGIARVCVDVWIVESSTFFPLTGIMVQYGIVFNI
jgi:predicted tellurium resistance membrane protein TerC